MLHFLVKRATQGALANKCVAQAFPQKTAKILAQLLILQSGFQTDGKGFCIKKIWVFAPKSQVLECFIEGR